jgi:hypothetical protein
MEYYYLGLEARVAHNKFSDLNLATNAAAHCARTNLIPVRIFKMLPSNISELVKIVDPSDSAPEPKRVKAL